MSDATVPEVVEVETGDRPHHAVLWLHGLGADGHDFEPLVPALNLGRRAVRWIFPHAPVRPVTLNQGAPMRAWYDLVHLDRDAVQDEAGIRASAASLQALIRREAERGIPPARLVLAGFSQGGAMALHTGLRQREPLAGVMSLSAYLPLADGFELERDPASQAVPVFIGHGTADPVVSLALGEHTRDRLVALGYTVEWRTYPMGHQVCPEEIQAIGRWLRNVLV